MSSPFIITGASGGSPNRLEINDFVQNVKFFSLYIQALQVMSTEDQPDIQSFFSLGGIHGLPYQAWDNVTGDTPFDPNSEQWGGYCTHGSVVFPTWHRPYVMLYEQVLQKRAEEIAATYTVDTEDWKQAALNLRHPFWDWALNAVPPDEVIALQQVTIIKNDGTSVQVENPLYHYKFHPIDPSFPDPYSGWQTTLRQPTSTDPDATDDVSMLKSVLASAQSGITASTYNMLTRVHTWPGFSNHTVGDGGSTSNSLEAVHDGIHVDVGGQGQMADPSVAAFDPIFFLHHCNVDRLLSMWAALNPGVWVSPGITEDGGSFTSPPGVSIDQNTALTPFYQAESTFWASAALEVTNALGFTYPDFNGVDLGNTDAVKTAISNRVNQLYGSSVFNASSFMAVPSSIQAPVRNLVDMAKKVPAALHNHNPATLQHQAKPSAVSSLADTAKKAPAPSPSHNPATPQQHTLLSHVTDLARGHLNPHLPHSPSVVHKQSVAPPDHGVWDWTARIEFKKYELGTSFSVLIFLGQVPENSRELRLSPNYVGGHHAFVNSSANSCANCNNQVDLVIEGFVHLNNGIAKHSGLGSLEPDVIEPYLTNNLKWKVQKSNREVVELESLEVTVIATPLTYPPNAHFPVPGEAIRFNQITYGQPGGSRQP